FIIDLSIEDAQGAPVKALLHEPLSAFGYASRNFTANWPTDGVLSGAYRAHAVLARAGGGKSEAAAPFTIAPDESVSAKVVTDCAVYRRGEPVRMTESVRNLSANADLGGLTALTQLLDAQGGERFRSERNLGTLFIGAGVQAEENWIAADPGRYTVRFAVRSGTAEIGVSTAVFEAEGEALLEGHLKATPAAVPLGGRFALSADAANTGTLDADGMTLRLLLIDPDRQTALRSFERIVSLPAGQSLAWEVSDGTDGLGLKSYRLILQAQRGGGVQTLATG